MVNANRFQTAPSSYQIHWSFKVRNVCTVQFIFLTKSFSTTSAVMCTSCYPIKQPSIRCDLLPDRVCLSAGWTQRNDSNVFPLSRICTFTTLLRSFTSTYSITTHSKLLGVYYKYTMNTDAGCVSIFSRLRVIVTQHKV